ncbi:MAG: DUF3179 domain-containing protein [Candidatus Andersenbacteria bacterium]
MKQPATIILIIVLAVVVAGGARWWQSRSFNLPWGGEGVTETIMVDNQEKEIMVTDGVKHSVPLEEIRTGCPGRDCIPSIDNPQFESVEQAATWLNGDDIGLALDLRGVKRFYPFRILVSHEIVNDTIGSQRVLVSYCPLCFTAIVFDPLVEGERVEFGVSGKLWNSNLLMYDRKTEDTLWSQVQGEAVVGPLTGTTLPILPSDVSKFGAWSGTNPDGEVLSRDTGRSFVSYDSVPYGGDLTNIEPFFPYSNKDSRLEATDIVAGIIIGDVPKAYLMTAVQEAGSFTETVGGVSLRVEYVKGEDAIRVFNADTNERIPTIPAFWFSWVSTHPETELYE